ncbi:hypothetical protein AVO45_19100 [Ruegeria marisrubri]|uniref:Peptidase S8/S53 domain-containing protein n=2 Tax=Ruegeria marisrubri TaxID=1685379 RepID=A0A0X3TX84_9RHOB|nr:hypothetical protein AVO45_19100 [Ruegeria marisrubri]
MIEHVELDYIRGLAEFSNDPYYSNGSLWGMYGPSGDGIGAYSNVYGSGADVAWNVGYTGSSTTVVGVNDTGIDPTHPDLYLNVWINQDEIPDSTYSNLVDVDGNGVITFHDLNDAQNSGWVADNNGNGFIDALDLLGDSRWEDGDDRDGNGFVDDLFGWNWQDDTNRPFVLSTRDDSIGFGPFRQDTGSHGVHVSGTIGGIGGNSEGVAGVNWDTQIVAMKTFYQGSAPTSYIIAANNYFAELASRSLDPASRSYNFDYVATNNSYVDPNFSQLELDSIVDLAAVDVLHVTAAGNSSDNLDASGNDAYPAEYSTLGLYASDGTYIDYDSVIAVAAIDSAGNLSSFSSYGATSVDIAAPGTAIWSAQAGGGYVLKDGTSMATPHVTGAVVLYAAYAPDASAAEIKAALLGSAAYTSSLDGYVLTDGRLDVAAMMASLPDSSNTTPVAADDSFTTNEDVDLSGNVLADNGNGADSDADGDSLTVALVSGPSNGVLTLNADGSFDYMPVENFNGDDSFVYSINDGRGGSDTATASIAVNSVNDAPVAFDDNVTTDENAPLSGNVLVDNGNGADFDVDGDTLTVALVSGPSNGALTLNTDGTFGYTPDANFIGADSFVYEIDDGNSGSDMATVSIVVNEVNTAPIAADDSFTTDEDVVLSGNVLADNGNGADSDADGDPLAVALVSGPSNGALTLNADGTFGYTPDSDFNGSDSFVYSINDGRGGSDTATASIDVNSVNDAPVAVDDNVTTDENVPLSGNVLVDNGNGADFDVDGDTLTVALVSGPSNGALTLNADGTFDYTPDANFIGADSFVYEIDDGNGGSDMATVSVTVNAVSADVYGGDTTDDILQSNGGIISGLSKDGTHNGAGTIDTLIGKAAAADTFLLGDSRGVFYDDESNRPGGGNQDYALLQGFEVGSDKLGLVSTANYYADFDGSDTYIYLDVWKPGSDSRNELIAKVEGADLTDGSDGILWTHIYHTDDLPIG